jgi:hypothetical protein
MQNKWLAGILIIVALLLWHTGLQASLISLNGGEVSQEVVPTDTETIAAQGDEAAIEVPEVTVAIDEDSGDTAADDSTDTGVIADPGEVIVNPGGDIAENEYAPGEGDSQVPLPGALLLFGTGLAGLGISRRWRR